MGGSAEARRRRVAKDGLSKSRDDRKTATREGIVLLRFRPPHPGPLPQENGRLGGGFSQYRSRPFSRCRGDSQRTYSAIEKLFDTPRKGRLSSLRLCAPASSRFLLPIRNGPCPGPERPTSPTGEVKRRDRNVANDATLQALIWDGQRDSNRSGRCLGTAAICPTRDASHLPYAPRSVRGSH